LANAISLTATLIEPKDKASKYDEVHQEAMTLYKYVNWIDANNKI
jgi:hypothetical protein